ncbi:Ribonuclease P/MRP protein subunit POP5 [Wickerhamiella sorbophila]|uniref:Ribonuclease P/MRP protein subunit POP5 n=1 Tax=Wickerhamiella sorbophila TaxID=45607 RepID=A0A2T0FD43_9ASCO|nr:Ribonuclease P/MRP protein subunit POP5 [Wickerhamiella sorbophila]PRT52887.1 Ribonuclease P/MRP protein subunit POP5 [Wickerhamiella sorbophila]
MVRLKTRYLLFELLFPDSLDLAHPHESLRQTKSKIEYRKVADAFKQAVLEHSGEQGLGSVQSSLLVKYFSPATMTGVLRVSREYYRIVQASLSYITEIDNQRVIVKIAKVSGTIKKSQQAAIAKDKAYIDIIAADTASTIGYN